MSKQAFKDANEARYLRKQQKDAGYDEDEEEQDKVFREDVEKAVNTFSKGAATKNLEKQVEYFGYKIEPFNMRQEEEMGQIDEEGFFVFSKKRQNGDAWLQSLEDNEEDGAVDNLRKKIKEEQGFQNVYDVDPQANQQEKSDEEKDQPEEGKQDESMNEGENKVNFEGKQVKLLLADLLPFATTVNKYLKQLKKQGNNQLYQKILYLCNEYIASTGEHDIFTMKKQDLEEELQQEDEEEAPLKNWDDGDEDLNSQDNAPLNGGEKGEEQDEDDIF